MLSSLGMQQYATIQKTTFFELGVHMSIVLVVHRVLGCQVHLPWYAVQA